MWFDVNRGNCQCSATIKQSIEDTKLLATNMKTKEGPFASILLLIKMHACVSVVSNVWRSYYLA